MSDVVVSDAVLARGTRRALWRLALATLLLPAAWGCAPAGGTSGAPRAVTVNRREERLRIGSFSNVQAVAVSRRYVFAAGSGGIAVYDRLQDAWLPPVTRDLGFTDQAITVIAGDPLEDALWIGVPGGVVIYRPHTEQLQRTILTGVPDAIAFERAANGDALVRSGGRWTRVSRVGMTSPVMGLPPLGALYLPPTLAELYQRFPTLRVQPGQLLRPQRTNRPLRPVQILSGAASPDRSSEVWLGTEGEGLYRLDPTFLQATPLPYGLLERGVGALALAADGVWAAGLGAGVDRAGLSFATNDLQRFRWIEGTIETPLLGVRTYALATRGARAWMGTDRGLVRVQLDGEQDIASWSTLDGLPDDRVLAVAPRGEGAWIGTPRGLLYVSDSAGARGLRTRGLGARLLDNVAVTALQFTGDTLWVGTTAGLLAVPRPDAAVGGALARPVGDDPALRRSVRALAWSDTIMLVATDVAVLRLAPKGGALPTRVDALDPLQVGQVTRVAIDERAMWLGGTDGLVMASRVSGAVRVLRSSELGGPITDLVASREWLWVGTPAGLTRLVRTSDGLIP